MASNGWIGVDLDGTLAHYDGWRDVTHIGEPVPAMLERVKGWLREGREVRIMTARVGEPNSATAASEAIQQWCLKHIGVALKVTNEKDYKMICLYDDRCVQVEPNTGRLIAEG